METLSTSRNQSWLGWFLRGLLILAFLVLFGRLVELQVIRGSYFRVLAESNRIRRVPIIATRGRLLARDGEVLVGNKPIKRRVIFSPVEGYEKTDDLTGSTENDTIEESIRDYKKGKELAHITGYLGEVSPNEVGKIDPKCTDKGPKALGSLIGRSGLEEWYDCKLRGVDGEELVEVDSGGNMVRMLGKRESIPGEDIKTNINVGLQEKIAQLMYDKKGSVIVTDNDGEVLALYSSPSYDPNIFIAESKKDEVEKVFKDSNLPLFNRAIGGMYQPGSTFKPIIAIAALEEGEIDKDYTYEDTGSITIKTAYGDFTYNNWYLTQNGGTEGVIKLPRAIARSTDTFFYKVGELLGIDNIVKWGGKFGFDKKTGIDLPGEISGLVPSPQWKMKVKGERWFLGNTYHVSIGQGDLAVTPIGLNTAIASIANGGRLCAPTLVGQSECEDLNIERGSVDLVQKGMVDACSSGGTGFTFFDFKDKSPDKVSVACKTGTAETGKKDTTHAWFTVFGPVDDEQDDTNSAIVVTVLVEEGGEGSRVAGPIARDIFNYWFRVEPTPTPTAQNDRT